MEVLLPEPTMAYLSVSLQCSDLLPDLISVQTACRVYLGHRHKRSHRARRHG